MSRLAQHVTVDSTPLLKGYVSFMFDSHLYRYTVTVIAFILFAISSNHVQAQRTDPARIDASKDQMVNAINKIRATGCRCGRQYKSSAPPVTWDSQLKKSSQNYAYEMYKYKRFGHNGIDGSVVGDHIRLQPHLLQEGVVSERPHAGPTRHKPEHDEVHQPQHPPIALRLVPETTALLVHALRDARHQRAGGARSAIMGLGGAQAAGQPPMPRNLPEPSSC